MDPLFFRERSEWKLFPDFENGISICETEQELFSRTMSQRAMMSGSIVRDFVGVRRNI